MKKLLSLLSIMLCMLCFTGCNNDDSEPEAAPVEVTVDSTLAENPAGMTPGLYLKVTFVKKNEVRYIAPTDILGFSYEEGYTYRLLISEMHTANSSEVYYILEKIISKTADSNPDQPLKPMPQ